MLSWFTLSEWLLLPDWSNCYKSLTSSSWSWLIITKYHFPVWQWISILLCRFVSVLYHRQDFFWTISIIGRVPYKKNEQLTLPEYQGLPHFMGSMLLFLLCTFSGLSTMLPVSLDFLFMNAPSVFSVYLMQVESELFFSSILARIFFITRLSPFNTDDCRFHFSQVQENPTKLLYSHFMMGKLRSYFLPMAFSRDDSKDIALTKYTVSTAWKTLNISTYYTVLVEILFTLSYLIFKKNQYEMKG